MKIAIATCKEQPHLIPTEHYLLNTLAPISEVTPAIWNDSTLDWSSYDLVIIRSTWDYHEHLAEFENWLEHLAENDISVLNSVDIIKNNIHKFYLKGLEDNGLPIISTHFLKKENTSNFSLKILCEEKSWDSIVVKPAVSCGAWHTYKLEGLSEIKQFSFPIENDWLIQPFVTEIARQGEISLMFFNNRYSHAVVKKAKKGDFRVQEEFGGKAQMFFPPSQVISLAQKVVDYYKAQMLYSRVDGVITHEGFKIMEVELIEPELFLLDSTIQKNFKEAILQNI